jgi:hypothetical protein
MPKPCFLELRERVVDAVESGASRREAADWFEVSPSSAIKWMQRRQATGSIAPKPSGGSISPLEALPRGSPSNNDLNVTSVGKREGRFAHQFARIERLLTFRDFGQQNIHERMLAVERRTAPVLGNDNPLDRC